MKDRCQRGIGVNVRQAQVLSQFEEEVLWNQGLLGTKNPTTLLNTVVFIIGKGFALHAGKEHRALRSPPFNSQISFMHDDEGNVFARYTEESGFKTIQKPKVVDMYAVADVDRCPVRILLTYLSKLPSDRKSKSLYLQARKKFRPDSWYFDRPVGAKYFA